MIAAKSSEEVAAMNGAQRFRYFCDFAGYYPDAPLRPYAIRVGPKTMFSADTMELREQFEKYALKLRRRMLDKQKEKDR